ncbi:ABC transporter ATP-binding protein/permease [Actinomyces sp. W5033]|uniref:ABC transporter ATP-binding protein/permease n=1 Tax=Actinomyces sp. W5033 TaxID=3446479 RepID=UPI003EDFDABE
MLELRSVTKAYRTASLTQTALDGVTLAFRDNEFVAVLGQSGSGKTTMLNVIGGLDHFDSGDLVIDGVSTHDYKDRDWDTYRNNRIGLVFQSYNLIPHQSVLANVELALTLSGVRRGERRRRALEALERVGLAEHVHKRPNQLSGGQMQRVAIARALINDPEILLADEPTGALDSATSVQVMDLLREVASDRLVIMVTHNPELAHEYATRIVELADGRVRSDSRPLDPATEPLRAAKEPRRTRMGPLTALALSFDNLMTKKGRTLMTSFAGSIGIIGIAMILALANGVNAYIARTEEETLSSYPLSIQVTGFDMTSVLTTGADDDAAAQGTILTRPGFTATMDSQSSNDLTSLKAFLERDGGRISAHTRAIEYAYNTTPQIYRTDTSDDVVQLHPEQAFARMSQAMGSGSMFSSLVNVDAFHQLPVVSGLYESSYDVVSGHWPQAADELVLVLPGSGRMDDLLEYTLGLRDHAELDALMERYAAGEAPEDVEGLAEVRSYTYADVIGRSFSRVAASDRYTYDETYRVWTDHSEDTGVMRGLVAEGQRLTVVGVVRANDDSALLGQGLYYTPALTQQVIQEAAASRIVQDQVARPGTDVFTGRTFEDLASGEGATSFDMSSLFTIDGSALQAAFTIDPNAFQLELSGLDMSGVGPASLDLPSLDMSGIDLSALDTSSVGAVDMSGVDLSSLDLTDISARYPQLAEVDYQAVITQALGADGVIRPDAAQQMATAAITVTDGLLRWVQDQVQADIADPSTPDRSVWELVTTYLAMPADPSRPDGPDNAQPLRDAAAASIDSALLTERLLGALGQDPAMSAVATDVSQRAATAIGTQIASQLGSRLSGAVGDLLSSRLTATVTTAMSQMMTSVQTALSTQIDKAMEQLATSMSSAMSIDEQAFAAAFRPSMDEQDLAALMSTLMTRTVPTYEGNLASLGWADLDSPSRIDIYPASFEDKDAVKTILEDYNRDAVAAGQEERVITYSDLVGTLMSSVTRIVNVISWMLIAFVAISLVVSSIMIAIITYISVLERKKEIGVLRAIGASRSDVRHVFNAETVIEGLLAGLLGVGVTVAASVPANALVEARFGVYPIAHLPVTAGVVLVLISVGLTVLAGLIPSGRAAREDPVEALRSE